LLRTAVAVAASASLLAGCGLFGDSRDRVLIVGDSVTYLSRAYLTKELDRAGTIDLQATSGLRTDELLPGAEEGVPYDPDLPVFMPGYNDVLQARLDRAAVPQMLDLAAHVPCSVWRLVAVRGVYEPDLAKAWNARVREAAADHDNVHLVDDWALLVD